MGLALAVVLAAAAVTTPVATAQPVLRHAGRELAIPASIEVKAGETAVTKKLAWRTWGPGLRAEASGDGWRAVVSLKPGEGARVGLDVEVRWEKEALVATEAVHLVLAGPATVVGRDLAWKPADKLLRVDRGTPAIIATRDLLVDGNGFVATRYEPSADAKTTNVALMLDDAGAHPFKVLERCLTEVNYGADPNARAAFAAAERSQVAVDRTPRKAGDVSRGHADLWLLDPLATAPAVPVIVERWPRGARAAVVFTDHADRTDPPALRAILYGTSDRDDRRYGKGGFTGHGIRLTKSFFARGGRGSLIDDPEAAALADELAATGSDISPHSISPWRDLHAQVDDGLGRFRHWGSNTWIDHQPYTNCEAITSLGWRDDGEYGGLRDRLVSHGYRWVWDMNDLSGYTGFRNVFTALPPGEANPPMYPLPVDPRIWVFRSTWFYAAPGELADALSSAALDQLERERGLFVGHTYLSATRRTTRAPDLAAKVAVKPVGDGNDFELDPRFDAALERLGKRVKAGTTASLTWREAGERLLAIENVEISYLADGRVSVENCGDAAIDGLTLGIPAALDVYVDGVEWFGLRPERERTTVWFDLPPRQRITLSASRHGRPYPFVRVPEAPVVRAP